jgi:hypothetical protein
MPARAAAAQPPVSYLHTSFISQLDVFHRSVYEMNVILDSTGESHASVNPPVNHCNKPNPSFRVLPEFAYESRQ